VITVDLDKQPILILGGGFAGVFTALHLCKLECPLSIKLIDRESRFLFKPLLYEMFSDEVDPDLVWPRYEDLLTDRRITFQQDTVNAIDLERQTVELASGTVETFRYLVIALGDSVGYFNVPGAKEFAFTFRTAPAAIKLSRHLHETLQAATHTEDPEQKRSLLTVGIVGAGPTGVELAATLADLLPRWYAELGETVSDIQIVLLHRDSEILETLNDSIRATVSEALANRAVRVDIRLNAEVTKVASDALTYQQHGEIITLPTATTIWTAGSAVHPLMQALPLPDVHRDPYGRPYVTSALQLIKFPQVFAGGDCAINVHAPQSATAQTAYQQGTAIARNLLALIENRPIEPHEVVQRGTLLKLGLEAGLADILGTVTLSGQVGHLIRRAAYLSLLPTPENTVKLSTEWIADEILSQLGL
jgi:NADH:ubiquinone reductase (non-electrogenic)